MQSSISKTPHSACHTRTLPAPAFQSSVPRPDKNLRRALPPHTSRGRGLSSPVHSSFYHPECTTSCPVSSVALLHQFSPLSLITSTFPAPSSKKKKKIDSLFFWMEFLDLFNAPSGYWPISFLCPFSSKFHKTVVLNSLPLLPNLPFTPQPIAVWLLTPWICCNWLLSMGMLLLRVQFLLRPPPQNFLSTSQLGWVRLCGLHGHIFFRVITTPVLSWNSKTFKSIFVCLTPRQVSNEVNIQYMFVYWMNQ